MENIKKYALPISIVLGLIGGALLFFVLNMGGGTIEAKDGFTLVRESGTVLFKESESSEYEDMTTDELTLSTGSFVKTKKDAFALVFLPDNSLISIGENSEVQVTFEENKYNIDQLVGKTWNRVQSVSSGGEYTVETPSAIAAVRGTIFGVTINEDGITEVYVQEGDVNVAKYSVDDITNILEDVDLEDMDHVDVVEDAMEKRMMNDEEMSTDWFLKNRIIDEIYERMLSGNDTSSFSIDLSKELSKTTKDGISFDSKSVDVSGITLEELEEALQPVIDIVNIDEDSCTRNSSADYASAASLLNDYSENVEEYELLNDLITEMTYICEDETIDSEELDQIRSITGSFN